jgi:hypothetical protein
MMGDGTLEGAVAAGSEEGSACATDGVLRLWPELRGQDAGEGALTRMEAGAHMMFTRRLLRV